MQKIGNFGLDRVVESEEPLVEPEIFFPESDPETFAAHADWLQPRHVHPATGKLILCVQSYIVRTGRHTILIDSCVGNDKDRAAHRPIWDRRQWRFLDDLQRAGLQPEDVDFVLCTHLHTDHVGWNTQLRDGRWVPTFPNAKYVFARDEYAHWEKESAQGSERIGLTFIDSVLPVMEAGQAVLVDHDHQIEDGIWLEPTPGHSPGHVIVNVESKGERGAFIGDLMHHPIQVPHPEWSTCFCWDLEMSAASRTAFVDTHTDAGTLVLPVHFAGATAGRIHRDGDTQKFTFLNDPS